jgi:hypothetical protein
LGSGAGAISLPEAVAEELLARTDGMPLFLEELTWAVLEAGPAEGPLPSVAIPASLHDSLMVRLDRLQPVKEAAQTAACIGREFTYPLLAAIASMPEGKLRMALDQLATAELVFRRGEPPSAIPSSTRWSAMPPTSRCCGAAARRSTGGSPRCCGKRPQAWPRSRRAAGVPLRPGGPDGTGDRALAPSGRGERCPLCQSRDCRSLQPGA